MNLFGPEKRAVLRRRHSNAEVKDHITRQVFPQLESVLSRIQVELERIAEKNFVEMEELRDVSLYHCMIQDIAEHCELLDLQLQRLENTYIPVSVDDHGIFRDYSIRICDLSDHARRLRGLAEERYKEIMPRERTERDEGCRTGLVGPIQEMVSQIEKMFSCTYPRKSERRCGSLGGVVGVV